MKCVTIKFNGSLLLIIYDYRWHMFSGEAFWGLGLSRTNLVWQFRLSTILHCCTKFHLSYKSCTAFLEWSWQYMAISIDFDTSETQKLDKTGACNLWQIQHPFGRSQVTVPEPSEDESVARAQWWDDGMMVQPAQFNHGDVMGMMGMMSGYR